MSISKDSLKRIKRNLVAVLSGRALMALRQVALVPLFIHSWGTDYYGHWLIATSIPTMLSMTNVGLGTSANIRIAMAMATDDVATAQSAYSLSQVGTALIGLIVSLATFWLIHAWAPVSSIFTADVIPLSYALMVGTVFIQMLGIPLLGWWTAIHRPSVGYHSFNLLQLVLFLGTGVLLICGGNAFTLIIFQATATLVWLVGFGALTHLQPQLKKIKILPRKWQGHFFLDLVKKGIGHQLASLWQALYFQGGTLIAAHALGAPGAALWTSLRTASRTANQANDVISQSVSTEIQMLGSESNEERLNNLKKKAIRSALLVAAMIFLVMLIFGKPAFGYWTLGKFQVDYLTWTLMCATAIPNALWWIASEFDRSTNKPWRVNLLCLLSACLSLILSVALGGAIGILGFAISYLSFELIMVAFLAKSSLKNRTQNNISKNLKARK